MKRAFYTGSVTIERHDAARAAVRGWATPAAAARLQSGERQTRRGDGQVDGAPGDRYEGEMEQDVAVGHRRRQRRQALQRRARRTTLQRTQASRNFHQ